MEKLLFALGLTRSKKEFVQEYGDAFFKKFKALAKRNLAMVLADIPDIGKSVFRFNFQFTPAYIAWYKAFIEMGIGQEDTIRWIWRFNENLFKLLPQFLMKRYGAKIYLGSFRKKAPKHEQRGKMDKLPEYDYQIKFHDIDENSFAIDIFTCGMKKLCEKYGAGGLFPGICRIDYLISKYMGCGFERNKTLGDGDEVCNCVYLLKGECEWNPEKGFETRK